jgi:hypothetical protein
MKYPCELLHQTYGAAAYGAAARDARALARDVTRVTVATHGVPQHMLAAFRRQLAKQARTVYRLAICQHLQM